MFEPSWEKLLIVLVIALVVLGPRKLPEVGHSLGRGIREFKHGVSGATTELAPARSAEEPVQSSVAETS